MRIIKKIHKQVILLFCGVLFAFQGFATAGIVTGIKGSFKGLEGTKLVIYNRESPRTIKGSDAVTSNGLFNFSLNLDMAGFYVISSNSEPLNKLEMYLKPGDQLTINLLNGQFTFSGKGSLLNQFLYENSKDNPYQQAGNITLAQTYINRVNAINISTNVEVIRNKALLLGNEQGLYLDQVFGPIIESKYHGSSNDILVADMNDLNISLVPEMMVYPNWWQTLTELMYARMNAGQLKIKNINTWVADFGNAIENQKLREAFMLVLLDNSVNMGDFRNIQAEMNAALPLIKNPGNMAKVTAMKAKEERNMKIFEYAPAKTDMSAFTFQDLKGKQVSIADFKGKLIYVDIWNTGCKPCIAEMPFLNKLEHEMDGKDIVFLSISCDYSIDLWKKSLQKRNVGSDHHLIMDSKKDTFFDKIGKSGIPRFVILDQEGKVLDNNACKRPSNPLLKIYLTELITNLNK
ncbi:MAG: TlpA disulfide reductase family protein [Candidatus Pedobacter colombiensis]|uniref:TlpA disulfide reductase family protein n=1 Tax=Candidatus Pedobacter colombiensis TaxID=3121371 RepID=A0AAJ5W7G1_9SPHI|nr:TlpA disulfide reductase family protein [Pedobacter sp.]WEK18475.1 MAG: TlpA disulfide reductase family protein [Pedobacter sp.]